VRRTGIPPEGDREIAEVSRARTPPAVDRLVRVADGHDRRAAEDRGQQVGLHDRGVLVLVEQHDAVARAQLLGDDDVGAHDLQGPGDLV